MAIYRITETLRAFIVFSHFLREAVKELQTEMLLKYVAKIITVTTDSRYYVYYIH